MEYGFSSLPWVLLSARCNRRASFGTLRVKQNHEVCLGWAKKESIGVKVGTLADLRISTSSTCPESCSFEVSVYKCAPSSGGL